MIQQLSMGGVDDRATSLEADHTLDMWFDYKASMPLSRYSIPSLVTSAESYQAQLQP